MIQEFFEKNYFLLRWMQIKRNIFVFLTRETKHIFIKGGDLISVDCQLFGIHEPMVTRLISEFKKMGFKDFFIDIGANIGISSCQNGCDFLEVHMFEPNPLCQKIAEVNVSINLSNVKWKLHPYGLGASSYSAILKVPKNNWGGGYIVSDDNSYDESILLGKESQSTFNFSDYLDYVVEIKETKSEINALFNELNNRDRHTGVIKIDVEGMEPVIIAGIAKALPENIKLAIIFESFNPELDFSSLIDLFKGRAKGYLLQTEAPFSSNDNKIIKILKLLIYSKYKYKLVPFEAQSKVTNDLVLVVT